MKKTYINIKYIIDMLLSLSGVIILSPIYLLISCIIKIDSTGPIIFKQERNGKDGKVFNIYKFRTMKTTDVKFSVDKAIIDDTNSNLTKVGRILRKLKLDELPQLFNVIKGDMSLVGPRPLMPEYLDAYEGWEWAKFNVRPGITGLAQVNGNAYLSNSNRSYYDLLYVENISLWLDIKILFKTILVVLKGEKRQLRRVSAIKVWEMKQYYTLGVNIPIDYSSQFPEVAADDSTDTEKSLKAKQFILRRKLQSKRINFRKNTKNINEAMK